MLADDKTIQSNLIDKGVITLRKQENRYINHLLFAHTTNRGKFNFFETQSNVEVIEDIVPVHNVKVSIKVNEKIKKVYLAPQMEELDFKQDSNHVHYNLDTLYCHQMVVLEY